MTSPYHQIVFTDIVRSIQEEKGSRKAYARFDEGPIDRDQMGPNEAGFIAERDSFYIGSVTETGWPYIQHRGGPRGFVRVIDPKTLAFPDFRGNQQYLSVGNFSTNDRTSLFFMDYANRARLKMLGHAQLSDDEGIMNQLQLPAYRAKVERAIVIRIHGFDWNCPQHITPRFTEEEVRIAVSPLQERIAALEAALTQHQSAGS